MSLALYEDDEYERQDSQSALDLAYWMLTYWSQSYDRSVAFSPNAGDYNSGIAMMQAANHAFNQVGIDMPNEISMFRDRCRERPVDLAEALHTRGAFLFKGFSMVFCLGDNDRVLEYLTNDYIVRSLTLTEKSAGFWDDVGLVPGVVYA